MNIPTLNYCFSFTSVILESKTTNINKKINSSFKINKLTYFKRSIAKIPINYVKTPAVYNLSISSYPRSVSERKGCRYLNYKKYDLP